MTFQFNRKYFSIALLLLLIEVGIAMWFKSGFIRHTVSDYLVVMLVYCIIRGMTNASVNTSALITICIAYAVEFLQLTPILELTNLNNYTLARIVFGTTFSVSDLIAYALGIITVLLIEYYRHGKTSKYSQQKY